MATHDRWLLLQAGGLRLAAPARQVESIEVLTESDPAAAASGAAEDAPLALAEILGGIEQTGEGMRISLRGATPSPGIRVRSADEMIQGPELLPLPALLRRALGESSPILGAILWGGRPILAVDLLRCIG